MVGHQLQAYLNGKKGEVLLGGNDEHGDAHRFGNTSQNSNDGPFKLVA